MEIQYVASLPGGRSHGFEEAELSESKSLEIQAYYGVRALPCAQEFLGQASKTIGFSLDYQTDRPYYILGVWLPTWPYFGVGCSVFWLGVNS
jgi:hypothetical protein